LKNNRNIQLLVCATLALVTVWAFRDVRAADFVTIDDPTYVSENLIVQQGLTAENLKWAFSTFYFNNYHPLVWLSYMAECQIFGLHPAVFHLGNLALHVANTLLLCVLLLRITSAFWASAIVAALFGLHPLHVESVAWISERKDVLSTLFGLLTIAAYHQYTKGKRLKWYLGAIVLFTLGLMSKAMLVTLPFALLLLDFWPLRRLDLDAARWMKNVGRLIVEKMPFFALSAVASYITCIAQSSSVADIGALPFSSRLENAFVSYARYLQKTFWPADLAVFYPHPVQWPVTYTAGAVVLIVGLSVVAVLSIRKRPWLFTGWFWFIGTLVPVIGLVQIGSQSIADRYMYLPSIGLFVAIVWGAREFIQLRQIPAPIVRVGAAALLIACALLTQHQVNYWRNSFALFTHAERVTPPNSVVLNSLGDLLLFEGRLGEAQRKLAAALQLDPGNHLTLGSLGTISLKQGNLDDAIERFQAGLRTKPDNPELNFNLGLALHARRDFAGSIPYFQRAVSTHPTYLEAHIQLGNALALLGDPSSAITNYLAAIRVSPAFAPAHYNAGTMFAETGRFEEALKHLNEAVRLKSDYSEAHRQLGVTFLRIGDLLRSRDHLREAVKLNPGDALAHSHLAQVCSKTQDPQCAISEYQEALRLDPTIVGALNNLAWIKATHHDASLRDGSEAVLLSEKACELTQRTQAFTLGTLAAAYAEAGRFPEALEAAEKAIHLAETHGQQALAERNRRLLDCYKANQPWREPSPASAPAIKDQQ
jgi:protein O-mannosyl-transferase